jgi:hypothetical protein
MRSRSRTMRILPWTMGPDQAQALVVTQRLRMQAQHLVHGAIVKQGSLSRRPSVSHPFSACQLAARRLPCRWQRRPAGDIPRRVRSSSVICSGSVTFTRTYRSPYPRRPTGACLAGEAEGLPFWLSGGMRNCPRRSRSGSPLHRPARRPRRAPAGRCESSPRRSKRRCGAASPGYRSPRGPPLKPGWPLPATRSFFPS